MGKVPLHGIGVQAHFQGPVDASTVKHRLDVLREVQLPVYITEFSLSGLDPAKHAYEMEKFLRIAFSHDAVAGITMGDLWDTGSLRPTRSGNLLQQGLKSFGAKNGPHRSTTRCIPM